MTCWVESHTCSRVNPNPSMTFSRWISWIGSFRCSLNVKCLRRIGASKHRVSISSEAAANTWAAGEQRIHQPNDPISIDGLFLFLTNPALANAAHWASASHGASTYGIPMSFKSCLQSSFCSLVTLTVRLANFSISSAVPVSFASACPASACAFRATRFASSPDLSVGGLPSKTYSGLHAVC